jgi:tetratricopeptide (TPR) repeat protein
MAIRTKTKRRLFILGLAFALLVGAGAAVYFRYVQKRAAEMAAWRSAGMAAYASGDYAGALPHFAKYHTEARTGQQPRDKVDLEALFAYAKSRASVEMQPGNRHLSEARGLFYRYLTLKPGDAEAEHMLLDIYPRLNMNQEAVTLADDVLSRRPDDVVALKAKTRALIQKGVQQDPKALAEAVESGRRLAAAAPLDVEGQLLTQYALVATKRPADEVVAAARAQLDAHPDDPRFELLLASAHIYANQFDAARKLLTAAATRPAPDVPFVRELVTRLDALSMYAQSQDVLDRAAAQFPGEPSLLRDAVQRQWQAGKYEAVMQRLAALDPASRQTDAALVGLRALSLHQLGRKAEAAPLLDALAKRGAADGMAAAWAAALTTRFADPPPEPRQQVEKYKAALEKDPGNAIVHYLRGEAFAALGEGTLAVEGWKEAARRAPSWALPRKRVAAALAADGRYAESVRVAQDAFRRDRGDLTTVIVWAQAAYGLLETMPAQQEVERLLRAVEEIQQAEPGEPNTLPIYAAVLARTGRREDAAKVIRTALESDPPPAPQVVARLAAVSREHGLGLDDAAAEKLRGRAGGGPSAAYVAAVERHQAGKSEDGLKLLNDARAKAAPDAPADEQLQWALALAQYLDLVGSPDALPKWVGLADQRPKDLRVQTAALRARCRQQDRDFWKRTIDRVKGLTVENSQLWRLEEAKWQLTGPALGEKEQASVLATLTELSRNDPYSAEPHLLLAVAHERSAAPGQQSIRQAAEEMAKASDLRPADVAIVGEVVRLMRLAGRTDEVGRYLDRAAAAPSLDAGQRLRLAELYAQVGQTRRAIEIASPLGAAAASRVARWHRALGQNDQAVALYTKLLDDPDLDAQTVLDGASFLAEQGKAPEAEQFVAKLDSLKNLQPGARELVRAKFAERHAPGEATKWYEQAAEKAAAPGVWRELAGHHLRHRRFAEALAAAEKGLAKFPQDADLAAMKLRVRELEPLAADRVVAPLLGYLSFDPRNAPANEMLSIVRQARGGGAAAADAAEKLRKAADKYPTFVPLQVAAVRGHLKAGEPQKAEAVARRAAAAFPDDVEPVRLVAAVYAAMGRWPEVRDAATTWRRLTPDQTLEPDLLVARAMLNTNEAAAAAERLAPHAGAETAKGDKASSEVLDLYARALIAAGKGDEAAAVLEPLARQSAGWRRLWLDLAGAFRSRDLEPAAKWILRVEPLVAKDVAAERRDLAGAWYVVGREFDDRESLATAKRIVEPLKAASDIDVAADAWMIAASCDEALGDFGGAESQYRQSLKLRAGQPAAQNNLAYVLLLKGGDGPLAEAHELASAAVAAAPNVASFHDTLARVEVKRGRLDAAATAFRRALSLEPTSVEAMIGLADVLSQSGRRDEARAQLTQIDGALQAVPRLPKPLAGQLEALRGQLRRTESGRTE